MVSISQDNADENGLRARIPGSLVQRKRRPVPPLAERRYFRRLLIDLYRNDRRYRNIIECEIRPRWQQVVRSCDVQAIAEAAEAHYREQYPPLLLGPDAEQSTWTPPAQLLFTYFEQAADQSPPIHAYVEAVYRRGVALLGLLHQGQPARWPAGFVHASVSCDPYPVHPDYFLHPYQYLDDPPVDPDDYETNFGEIRTKLDLIISPERAIASLYSNSPELQHPGSVIYPAFDCSAFDSWEEFEHECVRLLREWLTQVRGCHQARYPHRNEASIEQQRQDLPALFRHLMHGKRIPDKNQRDRVRDLAQMLGVDFDPRKRAAPKLVR